MFNKSGLQIEDSSYQYQVENGDNGAFVSSGFLFYGPDSDCGTNQNGSFETCWYQPTQDTYQTKRTTAHHWVWGASYQSLRANASAARGREKVCEDISWWPDTCSGTATLSFNY